MNKAARAGGIAFLSALAVQARVLSSGNLTPWWPAVIGLGVGVVFFALERRGLKRRAPEA
jgi:hypothetical protein